MRWECKGRDTDAQLATHVRVWMSSLDEESDICWIAVIVKSDPCNVKTERKPTRDTDVTRVSV